MVTCILSPQGKRVPTLLLSKQICPTKSIKHTQTLTHAHTLHHSLHPLLHLISLLLWFLPFTIQILLEGYVLCPPPLFLHSSTIHDFHDLLHFFSLPIHLLLPLSVFSVIYLPRWAHGFHRGATKTLSLTIPLTTESVPGRLSGPSTLLQVTTTNILI